MARIRVRAATAQGPAHYALQIPQNVLHCSQSLVTAIGVMCEAGLDINKPCLDCGRVLRTNSPEAVAVDFCQLDRNQMMKHLVISKGVRPFLLDIHWLQPDKRDMLQGGGQV